MSIRRRDFLKAAPVAAGAAALAAAVRDAGAASEAQTRDVRIGAEPYTPVRDYPIRAVPYSEVTLTDTFWKPKVDLNASVTIPFEVEKRGTEGRGFGGNVLEAAILSLKTHPNPALQAQVDARVQALRQSPGTGNGGFEVAAAWFNTTGKRDLIDPAINAADALYEDFRENNPPFSGGERDAINCLQLYRVTRDKKHLDLAKHYLDIRGLAQLGEPEPAQSVVQARAGAERSGRSRGERRHADGVAGGRRRAGGYAGVPRGGTAHVDRRGREEDVHHRRRRRHRQ